MPAAPSIRVWNLFHKSSNCWQLQAACLGMASSSFLTIDSVDTRIWGIWDCRYLVALCQSEGHHTAGGDSGVKYRRGDTHANALWPNAHSWVSRHGQNTIMYWKWTLQSVSIHVFTEMRMSRHGVWWPSGSRLCDLKRSPILTITIYVHQYSNIWDVCLSVKPSCV